MRRSNIISRLHNMSSSQRISSNRTTKAQIVLSYKYHIDYEWHWMHRLFKGNFEFSQQIDMQTETFVRRNALVLYFCGKSIRHLSNFLVTNRSNWGLDRHLKINEKWRNNWNKKKMLLPDVSKRWMNFRRYKMLRPESQTPQIDSHIGSW